MCARDNASIPRSLRPQWWNHSARALRINVFRTLFERRRGIHVRRRFFWCRLRKFYGAFELPPIRRAVSSRFRVFESISQKFQLCCCRCHLRYAHTQHNELIKHNRYTQQFWRTTSNCEQLRTTMTEPLDRGKTFSLRTKLTCFRFASISIQLLNAYPVLSTLPS